MKLFHHFSASSLPSGDQGAPLVLDVVQGPEGTRVFCANNDSAVLGADAAGGLVFQDSPPENTVPGGYYIDLPPQETVLLNGIPLPANPRNTSLFAGLNTLFAIAYDPDPQDIADWLTFNLAHSGAEAVLLVRRLPENGGKGQRTKAIRQAAMKAGGLKRFVLLDYDIPLGKAGEIPEDERLLVPGAPGKALLERPAPDIWRAPLGQLGIYAAVRWRFLATARAVLHCRISDLFMPGTDIFDRAAASKSFIKQTARFAYPWKIRKPGKARLDDHSCQRFDSTDGGSIWCARPGLGGHWRPFRACAKPPEPQGSAADIWRCMAVAHKGLKVAEMVPKSSLVEAPALVAAITQTLGRAPELPPEHTPQSTPLKNDRVLAVTTMKDEGPFILEWLAYHRSIGVTDFLVYTNDCSDGTDDMFDLLQRKGYVEHRQNPYREVGLKPQHAAYHNASESELAARADWIVCMDVDEFINIHVGDGTLPALFRAIGGATMISLTWRLFGNGDIVGFKDDFITAQLCRAAPEFIRKPHQAWGFKTMFRPLGHYKKFGVHRPKGLRPEAVDHVKWVNSNGHPMPAKLLRNGWRSSAGNWGYGLVTLNHYALRSAESFLVKRFRGRVNHVDRDQGMHYWFRMNTNATEDRSILDKLPRARAEFDRMMADPEIRAMHNHCVAAHRARIDSLLENAEYKALFDEITSPRMQALSKRLHYFGSQTFMDGPDSVPEGFESRTPAWEDQPPEHPRAPEPPAKPVF